MQWLWKQYKLDRGGILGDEMGLGKTVQVAAFLSVILGKTATSEDKQRVFLLEADDCRQVLIVVPSVTVTNWQRELSTWGYFRVKKAHGTDKADALRAAEARECEVVLTTYDALRIHLADFRRIDWHVTFGDEAHLLKNDKSERHKAAARIPCKRRYGLTGTPMSNKFVELWVLFNWVSNGGIGEKKHFESYYTRELGNGLKKNAKQWELAKRIKRQAELKDLNDQWMLQRFKSIIGHEMPKKLDHIVFCRLAAEQEEVYMRVLDSADYQQLLHMDDPCIAEGLRLWRADQGLPSAQPGGITRQVDAPRPRGVPAVPVVPDVSGDAAAAEDRQPPLAHLPRGGRRLCPLPAPAGVLPNGLG